MNVIDAMNLANLKKEVDVLPLRIWRDHVPVGSTGQYKEVDYVEYAKKGSTLSTTVETIERVKKHNPAVWHVVQPVYEAWQKGQEAPIAGTPLDQWPAVTRGQADALKLMHIRSVEDVATMNEQAMENFGLGARMLRDKAIAFITAKEGQAKLADALVERDQKIASQDAMIKELRADIDKLTASMRRREKPTDIAGTVK